MADRRTGAEATRRSDVDPPRDDARARPEEPPSPTTDGLVGALGERLAAQFDHGATTLHLAFAETRLAASSAALLLGIVLFGVALAFVVWLLLVALFGYALWAFGLSLPALLGVLLLAHIGVVLTLGLVARQLARDLRFAHTRRALTRLGTSTARPDRAHAERQDRTRL